MDLHRGSSGYFHSAPSASKCVSAGRICFVVLFRAPSGLSCLDLNPLPTPLPTPGALPWLSFPHFSLALVTGLLLWPTALADSLPFSIGYLPFFFLKSFSSITNFLHKLFALVLLASLLLKLQPLVFQGPALRFPAPKADFLVAPATVTTRCSCSMGRSPPGFQDRVFPWFSLIMSLCLFSAPPWPPFTRTVLLRFPLIPPSRPFPCHVFF